MEHWARTGTFFCVTHTTESLPLQAILVMPAAFTALNAYSAGVEQYCQDPISRSCRHPLSGHCGGWQVCCPPSEPVPTLMYAVVVEQWYHTRMLSNLCYPRA